MREEQSGVAEDPDPWWRRRHVDDNVLVFVQLGTARSYHVMKIAKFHRGRNGEPCRILELRNSSLGVTIDHEDVISLQSQPIKHYIKKQDLIDANSELDK